jgi:hypothetical protein
LLFVRHASTACALALIAGTAVRYAVGPDSVPMWWWAIAAMALVSSTVLTVVRTPTLRATGAELDRRLGLADHVAAALQLRDSPDPVARLVVKDATARLADLAPPRVFPLHVAGPGLKVAGAAAVALMAVWTNATLNSGGNDSLQAGVPGEGGAAVAVTSVKPPQARSQEARDVTRTTDGGASQRQGGATREATPQESPTRTSAADNAPAQRDPTTSEATASPLTGSNRASTPGDPGSSSASNPAVRNASDTQGAGGSARAAGSQTSSGGATSRGTGASADATDPLRSGAGGIRGGALTGQIVVPSSAPTAAAPPYSARYQTARARAESALAREEVPPALQDYVRNYFLAIRPASEGRE